MAVAWTAKMVGAVVWQSFGQLAPGCLTILERVDQLAKVTLDQDMNPLASVHYRDLKPLVNSYIKQLVQTKCDVAVHDKDLYRMNPTRAPQKKCQH